MNCKIPTYLALFLNMTLLFFSAEVIADGIPLESKPVKEAEPAYSGSSNNEANTKKESILDVNSKGQKNPYALSDDVLVKYQYCGKDSDCMEVINGCCQCLQGDKYVAIAKNRYEAFKKNFMCDNVLCPKEESSRNCSEGVISCINHKCSYFQAELPR